MLGECSLGIGNLKPCYTDEMNKKKQNGFILILLR